MTKQHPDQQKQQCCRQGQQREEPCCKEQPSDLTANTDAQKDLAADISTDAPEKSHEEQLEQLKKQVVEFKDKYLRSLAETENARKRMQKERQELLQYAIQNAIVDFLAPIDHLENALACTEQASKELKHWAVGFQMILGQFKDVLTANGVTPIISLGQPFDHSCHEAIEMVETTDSPPGTIIEEQLRGYKIGERVIRAARVKVAKAKETTPAMGEENEKKSSETATSQDN